MIKSHLNQFLHCHKKRSVNKQRDKSIPWCQWHVISVFPISKYGIHYNYVFKYLYTFLPTKSCKLNTTGTLWGHRNTADSVCESVWPKRKEEEEEREWIEEEKGKKWTSTQKLGTLSFPFHQWVLSNFQCVNFIFTRKPSIVFVNVPIDVEKIYQIWCDCTMQV